ncbi:MAG: hypothetical protein ACRDZ3_13500, partial [Acidimicrobiia bacterium]
QIFVDGAVKVPQQVISDTDPDTVDSFPIEVQDAGSEIVVEEADAPGWFTEISCSPGIVSDGVSGRGGAEHAVPRLPRRNLELHDDEHPGGVVDHRQGRLRQ